MPPKYNSHPMDELLASVTEDLLEGDPQHFQDNSIHVKRILLEMGASRSGATGCDQHLSPQLELVRKGIAMTTETIALKRYNSLFDNAQYSAIAADLRVPRDSVRTSDAMNLITDCALSLVNHPHYADAWLKLATFCGQNAISIPTIDAIYHYLLIYQQPGDNRAEEFELTAKALLKSYQRLDALKAAVSCANGVHGWRGRIAYDLLAASDYLVQAAVQLLIHGNLSYIREKIQSGVQRITGSLYEGTRHSERLELFDFSATRFPTTSDHR